MKKIISVYGSARPEAGSKDYQNAYDVGKGLAEAGFVVQTGGYGGVMAAASQGAAEAGGHVIGISCDELEQKFGRAKPNQWVKEDIRTDTLRNRLLYVVEKCDGMIVMPGGIGTLAELALSWNLLQVGALGNRPFVLCGEMYKQTLDAFVSDVYVDRQYVDLLDFTTTPDGAVSAVTHFFKQ